MLSPRRKPPVPVPAPVSQHTFSALLAASATAVLDASGNGIAVCAPSGLGASWTPSQVAVMTSTNVITPTATLYLGPSLPLAALKQLLGTTQVTNIAGTATGNNDSIGLIGVNVPFGLALFVQWLGGDANSTAIMTVTGTQTATYWR